MTSSKKVTFKSKGINLVGVLYLPSDFDSTKKYNAIVMTPPFPQVKDQAISNYAPRFAEKGYVALVFDYNTKGESDSYQEGFRNDDDMPRKWEDLRNAISFIKSQPFVNRLFGVGFCGGGNIMSSTIITDLRVEAFASVSAMLATDMIQFADKEAFRQMVTAANEARQKMFETGKPVEADYFGYTDPDYLMKNTDLSPAQIEGYDYYGTKRGGTERYPNYGNVLLSNVNESGLLNLGEQYADKMLQPYCAIVGSEAETAICTKLFYDKVTSKKEYHEIDGASHVDLYDKVEFIDQVVDKVVAFFHKHNRD